MLHKPWVNKLGLTADYASREEMLEVGVRFHNRPKQWEYCLPQFIFFTAGLVLRNPRCQSFCSTVNESRRCYVWCIWSFYLNTSLRRNQCNWHKLHNCQKLHSPVHDSAFTSYFFLSDSKIILRWLPADVRSPLNSSRPMSSRGDNDNNCNLDLSRVINSFGSATLRKYSSRQKRNKCDYWLKRFSSSY